MYSMCLFNTYVYYPRPKKHFFYSNEVGGVPDRVPVEKPPQIFHCLLKIKCKTVRSLIKFCKNQECFQKKLCHVCAASTF